MFVHISPTFPLSIHLSHIKETPGTSCPVCAFIALCPWVMQPQDLQGFRSAPTQPHWLAGWVDRARSSVVGTAGAGLRSTAGVFGAKRERSHANMRLEWGRAGEGARVEGNVWLTKLPACPAFNPCLIAMLQQSVRPPKADILDGNIGLGRTTILAGVRVGMFRRPSSGGVEPPSRGLPRLSMYLGFVALREMGWTRT